MEERKQTTPPPIPSRTPPPVPQAQNAVSPPPIPGKSRNLKLRRPPKGVEFQLYHDGFTGEFWDGNYVVSASWLTGSALIGFGIATAIGSGPFFWGFVALGLFGVYKGIRKAIGELRIRYREGKIQIRQGMLGFRQSKNIEIDVNEVRTIRLTRDTSETKGSSKFTGEAILVGTTGKSFRFGQDMKKSDRDYLYNVLVFFLDKEMKRVST